MIDDDKKCGLHMVERPCVSCGERGEWYPEDHQKTIALAKELAAERDAFRDRLARLATTCAALVSLVDLKFGNLDADVNIIVASAREQIERAK